MRPLLLLALVGVAALPSPAAASEPSLAGRVEAAKVVVVAGSADHMEQVLEHAKVPFVLVQPEDLPGLPLNARQVLMVNCRGVLSEAARERVKRFVTAGGFLYTTDHAVRELVEPLFPGTIAFTGTATHEEVFPVRLHGKPEDRGLLAHLGGEAAEHWQFASGGYAFKVVDPKKVEVLMDSPQAAARFGSGLIAARFRHQDGVVIHVTGHFYSQPGQTGAIASAGRAFEQLSANVVAEKEADGKRLDALYANSVSRAASLAPSPEAAPAKAAPALIQGARVKVLERKGGFARVRDEQGNEGWVEADAL